MPYDANPKTSGPEPSANAPQAQLALTLLAIAPSALGGLWLRGRASPMRDQILASLTPFSPRKLHPFMVTEALLGGLDLTQTLTTGTPTWSDGLLSHGGWRILTSAERATPNLGAQLCQALETDHPPTLIAVDESAEEGEAPPVALTERLGLFLNLDGVAAIDLPDFTLNLAKITEAQALLPKVHATQEQRSALVAAAASMGIDTLRAPLQALACARAHAALQGRTSLTEDDLNTAAALTLAHRALRLPEAPPQEAEEEMQDNVPPPPSDNGPNDSDSDQQQNTDIPEEMLIEAARAALPPGLIAQLQAARLAQKSKGGASGAGQRKASRERGRPLPSRPGRPGSGARVDIVATLREAAPWQKLRAKMFQDGEKRLRVLPSDIRLKRFQDRSERLLIFCVDASGSTAIARLAEAKGAIEIMLSDAYASRDHVAMIAFRGEEAELTLPPTKALVQAKRRLSGLPGGGGTPLASALQLAFETARQAQGRGLTPVLAFLTDGRGNIALDGTPNRAQAQEDVTAMAGAIRASGVNCLVLDTSLRPRPAIGAFARDLGTTPITLPRADANALSQTLSAALPSGI